MTDQQGSPTKTSGRNLLIVCLCAAALAWALHATNLLMAAEHLGCNWRFSECTGDVWTLYSMDTPTYEAVAEEILEHGFLRASYLRRSPGLPLLLSLTKKLTGDYFMVLWIAPWLAAIAGAAVVWLGTLLSGRLVVGGFSGLVFCLWPATYEFDTVIGTDGFHGLLVLIAFTLTAAWTRDGKPTTIMAATALWAAAQSLRPTLVGLPLIWPLLFLRTGLSSLQKRWGLFAWACTFVVPGFVIGSNCLQHGLATATDIGAHNLACYMVPRVKADLGMGDFKKLRQEAWDRYDRIDLKERAATQKSDAWAFFRAYPGSTLASNLLEVGNQMAAPPRPCYDYRFASMYPRILWPSSFVTQVFWFLAALGLLILLPTHREIVLILIALYVLIMAGASTSHLVGGRLRYPLDLLAIPLVSIVIVAAGSRFRTMMGRLLRRSDAATGNG